MATGPTKRSSRASGRRSAPARRLGTSEARAAFSELVGNLASHTAAAPSLADNAVEVGPHRKGGVWLVPEVDAQGALDRIETLQAKVAELEDEVENVALGLLIAERLEHSDGKTIPASRVIRELGFGDLAEDLPEE